MGPKGVGVDIVLVADADSIQSVATDARYGLAKTQRSRFSQFLGRFSLVAMEGRTWKLHRRLMTTVFQSNALNSYVADVTRLSDKLMTQWEVPARVGESVNVYEGFKALTLDVIGKPPRAVASCEN